MRKQICYLILVIAFLVASTYAGIGFPIESSSVPEGSTIDIGFGDFGDNRYFPNGVSPIFCEVFINEGVTTAILNVDYTWSLFGSQIQTTREIFQLSTENDFVLFTVEALNDNIIDDMERVFLSVRCYDSSNFIPTNAIVMENCNFDLRIVDSGVSDDPHFFQLVKGTNENGEKIFESICYDLYGAANDVFELLTDSILKLSVFCKLRDDYYMSQVRVETPLDVFIADTEYVSIKGKFQRSWNDIQKYEKGSDPLISVELMDNAVLVSYKEEGRKMAIRVERKIQQQRGKSYLNFFIEETRESAGVIFDKNHGGLFGVAANNQYNFTQPVQENGNMAEVVINKKKVNAYYQASPTAKANCYLLNLEDVIAPYSKSKFMRPF